MKKPTQIIYNLHPKSVQVKEAICRFLKFWRHTSKQLSTARRLSNNGLKLKFSVQAALIIRGLGICGFTIRVPENRRKTTNSKGKNTVLPKLSLKVGFDIHGL